MAILISGGTVWSITRYHVFRKYAIRPYLVDKYISEDVKMMQISLYKVVDYLGSLFCPIKNERGATAVEYGLIVALIAVTIIVALTALSGGIEVAFNNISDTINGVAGA
jgi:pilus assembly protein Flp/PilA